MNREEKIERAKRWIIALTGSGRPPVNPLFPIEQASQMAGDLADLLVEMIKEMESAHKRIKELEKPVVVEFPESAATVQPLEYRGPMI